ncbi:MAG: YCF48-related protein [Patescibacteria group bacterium]|nr:YCF48-related protein [Patescibacteria group bacterium]
MKKNFLFVIILFSLLLLSGQGCVRVQKGGLAPGDGGLWISKDKGETWQQKVAMPTLSGLKQLNDLNITLLVFDPQDSQTIYLGGENAGLYFSYDNGESWQEVTKLPKVTINALAVDPKAKNIVYAAIGHRIFKTTDCCRSWKEIYLDVPRVTINALAIDSENSKKILVGLADGRLIKSEDGGVNWKLLNDFKNGIKQILFNNKDPRIIYLGTLTNGLFRSDDGGNSWQKVEGLENFPGSQNYKYGLFNQTKKDALFILTEAGFFRSDEEGKNWQGYQLLTKPGQAKIYSFAINPKNPDEIYYATENTFYKSNNGGRTWITKNLPTKRLPLYLSLNPENPNILYLATYKPAEK